MFNSAILEVAIGVVFVYALFSTICAALREAMEGLLKTRAAYLEHGIRELLHDPAGKALAKQFFEHPLIFSLYSGEYKAGLPEKPGFLSRGGNMPSYIPTKNFATALLDLIARGPVTQEGAGSRTGQPISLESLRANARLLGNAPVARAVLSAIDMAEGDLARVQANLEAWYDSTMDRVSGWYKRHTQGIIFIIGLTLAVLVNVDTVNIANGLYKNTSERQVVAGLAAVASSGTASNDVGEIRRQLAAMPIPIGWNDELLDAVVKEEKHGFRWWAERLLVPIPGWALTALAATLGAPFWFDVLNKVMVIRSTVKPHEKSGEESSDDRQSPEQTRHRAPPRDGSGARASDATGARGGAGRRRIRAGTGDAR
jgi:hypothetical protein